MLSNPEELIQTGVAFLSALLPVLEELNRGGWGVWLSGIVLLIILFYVVQGFVFGILDRLKKGRLERLVRKTNAINKDVERALDAVRDQLRRLV